MPAALTTRSLTVTRGADTVLDAVDLQLTPGQRVGIVGPNGIGKSTLLQALAGRISDSTSTVEGSVEITPKTATVGYLPQEPDRSSTETVHEFLARRTGVAEAQAGLDATTRALADGRQGADDDYGEALERWLALGAADFEARVGQVLADLGIIERVLAQPTATLSGGEAARISLASLLLSRFDVVLLDEPTNDLDIDGLDRLERWVCELAAPVALVSHDRAFLERTITGVAEIDHHSHRVTVFNGGWVAFLDERIRARARAQARYDEYDTQRRTLLDRRQREREWAAKGAGRVRRSDERDKFIRHHQLNQTEQLAGRSAQTDRAIERLEQVEEPRTPWELRYDIPTVERSGDIVATADAATVRRGDFRLGPVSLDIAFGDRVAIVGANGTGKTTLLELLLGRIEPTSGRAGLGANVVIGEIEQARTSIVGVAGLLEAFGSATGLEPSEARTLLAKFGLGPGQLGREGSTLSPGERTRAALAVMMANGANLLVLDEPTNHLDLEAIEQLEAAVDRFAGTVLMVTHDRALLEAVSFDRVLSISDGNVEELDPRTSIGAGRRRPSPDV
ncbi:ABC-F family ATP-binding cassette domain-containing protein [Ilumatobacter nonamiensis]|uniref:ABC-F family ATP-binding cassette domain-containing protein n=1 Tax=Ilumatobacter nonamiensis TaxID=467093 RepID=UPI00034C6A9C|nr:ABC-F family ATP-binding cassette domain-containing protein [Ilumatobacter nonamiensis]